MHVGANLGVIIGSTSSLFISRTPFTNDLVASRDPSILIFIIAYTAGLKGNLSSCDNVMNTNIISYTKNSVYKYN